MNKNELLTKMSERSEKTKKDLGEMLEAFTEVIMEAVANGDKVQITDFGTFERIERKARTGRNPRTKEEIQIPETLAPKFKPSKNFKERVK